MSHWRKVFKTKFYLKDKWEEKNKKVDVEDEKEEEDMALAKEDVEEETTIIATMIGTRNCERAKTKLL